MLLSGTFEPFDRERAERLGCDAIVSKPFDSQQLLRAGRGSPGAGPATSPLRVRESQPRANPAGRTSQGSEEGSLRGRIRGRGFHRAHPRAVRDPERADLFEEEYGRGDVDSAIAAFEKSASRSSPAPAEIGHAESALREDSELGPTTPSAWLEEEPDAARGPAAPPRGGLVGRPPRRGSRDHPLDFDPRATELLPTRARRRRPTQEIPRQMFRMDLGAPSMYSVRAGAPQPPES